jgi:hypothetical protein
MDKGSTPAFLLTKKLNLWQTDQAIVASAEWILNAGAASQAKEAAPHKEEPEEEEKKSMMISRKKKMILKKHHGKMKEMRTGKKKTMTGVETAAIPAGDLQLWILNNAAA